MIGLLLFCNRESFGDVPPFKYPTYIQQPLGPQGWGYRDPCATYRTVRWNQTRMPLLTPDYLATYPKLKQYLTQESAPVPKMCSPFEGTSARPKIPKIPQRPVSQAPYASW